ncbi:helix-turn-helix domain-containing protein [Cellulomonas telluris]|uniref:helix-turn-helix domain-containing protein n=1 Tax=Cellulomonas telluris TaxID=2306636 RepID=UPI0010A8FE4C|nr:helix-turn-helix domain-containing protein [Cellulomonas telluris]
MADATTDLVSDALRLLGVRASTPASDRDVDLVLRPGGTPVQLTRRALVDRDAAQRILTSTHLPPGTLLLVVGDRVTREARDMLLAEGAGYFDLRGRLAIRAPHLVIDTDLEPHGERRVRKDPVAGRAGLEVATALLLEPDAGTAVRELARVLTRSPSTVSEVLKALRAEDLIDDKRRVPDERLFWRVAERWTTSDVHLARIPPPGDATRITASLRLGLVDPEHSTGWALTDAAAAATLGAPMAVRSDHIPEFYVPDETTSRRAEKLLGRAPSPGHAACVVRVAPVPAVCARRVEVLANHTPWPLAHPVFVALDLAQDVGRGREILDAWVPSSEWRRVW